jgi:hypothetical protein
MGKGGELLTLSALSRRARHPVTANWESATMSLAVFGALCNKVVAFSCLSVAVGCFAEFGLPQEELHDCDLSI